MHTSHSPSAASCRKTAYAGFTLLEVMMVLALLGIVVSMVSYSGLGTDHPAIAKKQAQRLQVVFDMASDYAVLNQLQMGMRIDEQTQSYEFVQLDDEDKWVGIEDPALFASYQLPEGFRLQLDLDNLPWAQEESLIDAQLFDEELSVSDASVSIGEDDEPPPPPQILLLSSGDITPFELFIDYQAEDLDVPPVLLSVQGKDFTPLVIKEPEP